jgi:hypothetical protein
MLHLAIFVLLIEGFANKAKLSKRSVAVKDFVSFYDCALDNSIIVNTLVGVYVFPSQRSLKFCLNPFQLFVL